MENKDSLFEKIWAYGKEGCTCNEHYLDLPDGINVGDDCVCAQVCAYKVENEVLVYVLNDADNDEECWGEFKELWELPIDCLKAVIFAIENYGKSENVVNCCGGGMFNYDVLEELNELCSLRDK